MENCWLKLDPGRESAELLLLFFVDTTDDGAVVVAAARTVGIRSKRMAKQRSSKKMGRISDALDPGRDEAVAAIMSRDEITLIA